MQVIPRTDHRFRPALPGRVFRSGEGITFMPPPGAYSQKSMQSRCNGKAGIVAWAHIDILPGLKAEDS